MGRNLWLTRQITMNGSVLLTSYHRALACFPYQSTPHTQVLGVQLALAKVCIGCCMWHLYLCVECLLTTFRALVHSNSDLVTAKFLLLLQNVHHTAVNMVVTLPSEDPVSPNCLPLLCSNAFTRSAEY